MAKKIILESIDLPSLDGCKLDYGAARGWQRFDSEQQAQQAMLDFLNQRIHSTARQLDKLCQLQRKLLK